MRKRLVALFSMVVLILGLVACGKPSTIEKYYGSGSNKKALDEQFESMRDSYSSIYSDITYKLNGNTLTYIYTFKEQIPESDDMDDTLDSELSSGIGTTIDAIEKESGVTGVSIQYIYYNKDGTELFNKTYSK